ncbi:GH36-type glycosyl hydrolase domain-containing protein [Jeongeupia naejangsanensis]|nr:glucoamylase family protein [Jeongeupia naejangsanensis]
MRATLFSAEQMAQHGKMLAAAHAIASGRAHDQLLARLADNESTLISVCKSLTEAVTEKRRITPAGEWLLDNFYLIEEQIRTAKRHLPKGYSQELPRLAHGPSTGRPRVYDIALEIISHGDGRVDTEGLRRFVAAYQSVTPLTLGELWAIPIMLRLAIIENLRRVGVWIAAGRAERNQADVWADQMIGAAETDPKSLILVIADMARARPPMVSAFVAELARRLQGRGPALTLPLTWIEQHLSESGLTIEHLVQQENQQQANDQVSISNSIGSLRILSTVDWREFVEHLSIVEQTLLEDPAHIYASMDFASRDHYRHAVASIARLGQLSEGDVARKAVELAGAVASGAPEERTRHVGFYLIDRGLPQLERAAQIRLPRMQALRRSAARHSLCLYLGAIQLFTIGLTGLLLAQFDDAMLPDWAWAPIGLLLLLATSQLAVALVNWLTTLLVSPHPLPRMDFCSGVPSASRTLVVVPTLLTSPQNIEDLVEALEVRFLANRDAQLHFGLLTDLRDAQAESLPEDEQLLQLAQTRIAELNAKYASERGTDAFFLFHRHRRWNPQERVWMGHERKRGKLADLNALLRSGDHPQAGSAFALIVGDTSVLPGVRYVITLDTDTQLPRDAARQFIGTMAHPLNRPRYDNEKRRVVEGYGILQPCVAISLPGTNRSLYAQLYGGEPGIDPYTRAVSDVYQDVFGEGSFIGKGIYDVDAFESALSHRFPENRILSHDLLEGCYARAGLLSDVPLYEAYPGRYSADVSRRHRWIRGDWQLAGWLLRRVPGVRGSQLERQRNPLSALSQWKLADNLRRSLVPVALTLLLLLGWIWLPFAWLWTLVVVGIKLVPSLFALAFELFRKPPDIGLMQHLSALGRSAVRQGARLVFELACLPYEALFSLDAILRTTWRMLITRRRLLEWNPSSEVEREADRPGRTGVLASFRAMRFACVIAVATTAYLLTRSPATLLLAGPILLLWFGSPAIAWWISLPRRQRPLTLSSDQLHFLRALSRRTWAFFDHLVGPADHWLPPDNYQSYRITAIAHRTSPTNIGLALLANLAAHDFGYIPAGRLLDRTANTLKAMGKLERYRGHFYNWYDTQTMQPLPPLYVSTVDSGNLAGHLLTLQPGLLALADAPIHSARAFDGLQDTLSLLLEAENGAAAAQAATFRHELVQASAAPPDSLDALYQALIRLDASAAALLGLVTTCADPDDLDDTAPEHRSGEANPQDAARWALALARQCREALDELVFLAPWLLQAPAPVGLSLRSSITLPWSVPTLRELAQLGQTPSADLANSPVTTPEQARWLAEQQKHYAEAATRARDRIAESERLAAQCAAFAQMDYDFLFDKTSHLLVIGYNASEHRADASYYDLLASEARLCSFVAIAQGQVPQASWFALGRLLTRTNHGPVLLSWSGSMFEYLMPMLVMPSYENTLLEQTCKAAVARQIEYGRQRNVPWGVSESGYNTVDAHLNYQYRAFGVPGLGLKRGLADDLVIAPYAATLALMVAPEEACQNLQLLAAHGLLGKFGFFEAVDYTPARQRRGQTSVAIRSFMAHHQGMSLLALAYVLLDRPMQRRFESDRLFQAVMLLLQERIPRVTALFTHTAQRFDEHATSGASDAPIRIFTTPDTPTPEVQLLSNGRYHVMVSNAGGGYSRWKDLAVTRWREDGTCDQWGTYCFLRDIASGRYWSTSSQPTAKRPAHYEAIFSEGRAEFRRRDALLPTDQRGDEGFETHTDIVVSPEDDIELRRVRVTNRSSQRRNIDITSYAEVAIAPPAADELHPAFSKLFVQTEILPAQQAILCTRRPRAIGETVPWMLHLLAVRDAETLAASYETDRARFIGRTRSVAAPLAMDTAAPLSGTEGSVLDPVAAIRISLTLEPGQSATIDMLTGMAETREAAVGLVGKYQDRYLADRVFDLAWTHSQIVLQQLNATEADAQLYAQLAGAVIYANASLRADAAVLIRNRRGQSGLWGYAISGDLPIVLLQIGDAANIDLVRQLVQAHAYWRLKGLSVDLVIWNEDHAGYRQRLQEQIMGMITSGIEANVIDRPGGIFVRSAEQISAEDRTLFQSVARAVITDAQGSLAEQLDHRVLAGRPAPLLRPSRPYQPGTLGDIGQPRRDLLLFNGLGGFNPDGSEYVMTLAPGQITPAPWVNVLANPAFGTVVSESGSAYTWSENAHELRLTPWHNDPVGDACGEALYLRDEETGYVWSPTPLPVAADAAYVVRHGFGYSVFETLVDGIRSALWVYVAQDAAIKFTVLRISNESGQSRQLSATGYVEWVLGDLPAKSAMHVTTEINPLNGALYARNPYSAEFAERVAFFDVDDPRRHISGDRTEFLGRNGTLQHPIAMRRTRLSGKVGAGLDPCAAIRVSFDLAAGQTHEIVFRLGIGRDTEDAGKLVHRFRGAGAAHDALEAVQQYWRHTLGAVKVDTPDPAVNLLANGWLVYQTLASRLWARSGYYQSGGAYGFRDQLQDVMALIHAEPMLVRAHLLRAASRQFVEGDVQHWWHPPSGRGVRTRCSDDYLWLPLAVCRYVNSTRDTGVLGEPAGFLEGRAVNPEDESYFDLPGQSTEVASLYQHCVRAIRYGLRFGEHGLPLIGAGDWNDGMNLVGIHGKGESVWLGFFLHTVLGQFAELARTHGDPAFADKCKFEADRLRNNIEQHGWDGQWYRRAYFDDGAPLGSASNDECQIDSISQSWAVLSGAGDTARTRMAMEAVSTRLVNRNDGLIQLLDPPFDRANLNPGYIRGYVPGVRENGGQYTHGAVWTAMAFAALGEHERAWEMLAILNPLNHTLTPEAVARYKVEPYVIAADVYAVAPHTGRGGWSWYTGSAGWTYRLITESLLGLQMAGETLHIAPRLPTGWQGFKLRYRYRETQYHITVSQLPPGSGAPGVGVVVDGHRRAGDTITLVNDHREHKVEITVTAA